MNRMPGFNFAGFPVILPGSNLQAASFSPLSVENESGALKRTLNLPLLVFYGVGVTIGAGIFALLGEILAVAGDRAPLAFLLSGLLAGITGFCYMQLVKVFPRAGGEAVFVNQGMGPSMGRIAGLGVVVTGIVSSAVISIAFAGYVHSLVPLPEKPVTALLILGLALVAWWGVKESVIFAAVVTLLEVGILVCVILLGLPMLAESESLARSFSLSFEPAVMTPVLASAVMAFFAFVGFEDIANMAEETVKPRRNVPLAILFTLVISVTLYVLLALTAAQVPDRASITESGAPMAALYEAVSGRDPKAITVIAAIAMLNGILVQIVMASRVLFGMAGEGLLPGWLAAVDSKRRTPHRAIFLVAAAILALALFFPLVRLAQTTSLVTLSVFTLVDISLFLLGCKRPGTGLARWRWVGLVGAVLSAALVVWQVQSGLSAGH